MGNIQKEADNLVNKYLKEQQEKEKIISQITNKQAIDNAILIEKTKTEQQELINSVLDQNKSEDIVAQAKEQYMSKEEFDYVHSPYYSNYKTTKAYIKGNIDMIIQYLNSKYLEYQNIYRNPFYHDIKCAFTVKNIGFPMPKTFEEELINHVQNCLGNSEFQDAEYIVNIDKVEYAHNSQNVIQKIDGYQIIISLKQKNHIYKK